MCKINPPEMERNKNKLEFICPHCEQKIDDFKNHAFKDDVNSLCNVCDLAIPNGF